MLRLWRFRFGEYFYWDKVLLGFFRRTFFVFGNCWILYMRGIVLSGYLFSYVLVVIGRGG